MLMKPRKHFIEHLVSSGHNMAETGPTKNSESREKLRRTEHKKARTKTREKEIYLDRVERVADYNLGDAGGGSGDVLLGRIARSGHLKNWRRAQVLECLRRGKCRTGGLPKGKGWPCPSGIPAPAAGRRNEGEGTRKRRPHESPRSVLYLLL